MVSPGSSRERLVQRLNAAYVGGLISDATLVDRLDQVLHRTLVDPDLLVGDLHLPRGRAGGHQRVSQMVTSVVATIGAWFDQQPSPTLLALDWSAPFRELFIGRSTGCDLVLTDVTVSRCHARLIPRDGFWVFQDLCSTNGSYLNGHRVSRCQLHPGDRLTLGEAPLLVD